VSAPRADTTDGDANDPHSYQRGKRNTNPGTSLLKLEGVDSTEAAQWYAGKRVAYVYRAQRAIQGNKIRVIWGESATSSTAFRPLY
jgi:ribosomal protein L35AE/L33A